ncbi:MAG: tetratricopeptide repeat protein, partial [Arachnia sp.]
ASNLATALTEEVLTSLDGPTARAVTMLAQLPAFDADLCTRLSISRTLLDDLAERGVIWMKTSDGTWQMSSLIRTSLAAALSPSEQVSVRRIAAAWHADRGDAVGGVELLRSDDDADGLLEFLEQHAPTMVNQGQAAAVVQAAESLAPATRPAGLEESLGRALMVVGRWEDSLACMERAKADAPKPSRIARWTGLVHHLRGDLPKAVAAYASAGDGPDHDPDLAALRAMHAAALWVQGDLMAARVLAGRALAGAVASGDAGALAAAHTVQAMLAAADGDRRANDVHDRLALEFAEQAGDALQIVRIRSNRGSHLTETGQLELAITELTLAIELAELAGYAPFLALARSNRGEALAGMGRHDEAVAEFLAAAELYDRLGSRLVSIPLLGLAEVYLLRGEVEQAMANYERVLGLVADGGSRTSFIRAAGGLGRVLIGRSPVRARELVAQAHDGAEGMSAVPGRLAAGWVALLDHDPVSAAGHAADARASAERRRDDAGYAEACELTALASPPGPAEEWADRAVDAWSGLGDPFRTEVAEVVRDALIGDPARVRAGWASLRRKGMREGATAFAGPLAALVGGYAPAVGPEVFGGAEPRVSVRLLGGLRLYVRGKEVASDELSPQAWEVLRLAATGCGRAMPLAELTQDANVAEARDRLAAALGELKDLLDPDADLGADWYLVHSAESVRLQTDHLDLDVAQFLTEAQRLTQAAELDIEPADLLERFGALEASYPGDVDPGPKGVAVGVTEECRAAYLRVLRELVQRHDALGATDQAVRYALRLLTLDPADEPTALTLIRTLEESGRFGEARRYYRQYTARMRTLDIEPAPFPQSAASNPGRSGRPERSVE